MSPSSLWTPSSDDFGWKQPSVSRPILGSTVRLIGDGPAESAVSHVIDRQPFCWDCNGFYRRLGLPPGSPRIEVARAYMDRNGHRSASMTNAVEVLLNKRLKPFYDALPLGSLWPYDVELIQQILAGALTRADHLGEGWSYYLADGLPTTVLDHETLLYLDLMRTLVSYELWMMRSPIRAIALGVATQSSAVQVGYRFVLLLDLTGEPNRAYAASVAQAVHSLSD